MKNLFLTRGNICGKRVKLARIFKEPSMTQEELAVKIQLMGMEMTAQIISRIELNNRHVCDAELYYLAKALDVSMDWLCGNTNDETPPWL